MLSDLSTGFPKIRGWDDPDIQRVLVCIIEIPSKASLFS